MSDWYEAAVKNLLEIAKVDSQLAKLINARCKQLEREPTLGQWVIGARWIYTDPSYKFRINYNYNAKAKNYKAEIVAIYYRMPE